MKLLADALELVLADTYALFLKTQNYHWNVEGCCFKEHHELFEKHYDDLFEAIDVCAELIRGLGVKVDGTFENFSKKSTIKSGKKDLTSNEMLEDLANDQEVIEKTLKKALEAAQKASDEVIAGFITDRMTVHRKNAWFLKSSICKSKK